MTSYKEFKASVVNIEDLKRAVEKARLEYGVTTSFTPPEYLSFDVPFNLEQEYFDLLMSNENYAEAKNVLDRMKHSYDLGYHNLIEAMEYRMNTLLKVENSLNKSLIEAKKEFNQHSITLVSIVVGIITIFGTANQTFKVDSFSEGISTFLVISLVLIALIAVALITNAHYRKK